MRLAKRDIQYILPARISIIGPMGCGKSHWVYQFVEHMRTHTNINELSKNINILFAYNENSSVDKLKESIKKSGLPIELKTSFQFPTITELQEDTEKDNHKIVILEGNDCASLKLENTSITNIYI